MSDPIRDRPDGLDAARPFQRPAFHRLESLDPEVLKSRLEGGQARHVPIADGRLQAELWRIPLDGGWLNTCWTTVPLWIDGAVPALGPVMLYVQQCEPGATWCGRPIEAGTLIMHGAGERFDSGTAGTTGWAALTLAPAAWSGPGELAFDGAPGTFRPDAHHAAALGSSILRVVEEARSSPESFDRPERRASARRELRSAFLDALQSAKACKPPRRSRERVRTVVLAAVDKLGTSGRTTVGEVAKGLQVPRRSLERGFHAVVGTGPSEFARRLALTEARARLLHAGPGASVAEIARGAGFAHLGRFAGFYKRLFGERPLDTLKRTRGGHAPA